MKPSIFEMNNLMRIIYKSINNELIKIKKKLTKNIKNKKIIPIKKSKSP